MANRPITAKEVLAVKLFAKQKRNGGKVTRPLVARRFKITQRRAAQIIERAGARQVELEGRTAVYKVGR